MFPLKHFMCYQGIGQPWCVVAYRLRDRIFFLPLLTTYRRSRVNFDWQRTSVTKANIAISKSAVHLEGVVHGLDFSSSFFFHLITTEKHACGSFVLYGTAPDCSRL